MPSDLFRGSKDGRACPTPSRPPAEPVDEPGRRTSGLGSERDAENPSEGSQRERKYQVREPEDQRIHRNDREAGDPPIEQIEAPRLKPPPQRDSECRQAG